MRLTILIAAAALLTTASTEWAYTTYKGDGTEGAGWPSMDKWIDFETMWTKNKDIPLSDSCQNAYGEKASRSNSPAENEDLKAAIISASEQTGVDKRFILAVVMQEANGCVNIHTTTSGDGAVRNPAVMQDHDGDHTCNLKHDINVARIAEIKNKFPKFVWNAENQLNPCPKEMITGMVLDGVKGTLKGDGIVGTLQKAIQFGGPVQHEKRHEAPNPTIPIPTELLSCNSAAVAKFSNDVYNAAIAWIQYAYAYKPGSITCAFPGASSAPPSPPPPPPSTLATVPTPAPPPPASTAPNSAPAPAPAPSGSASQIDISKANAVAYYRAARMYNSGEQSFNKDMLEAGRPSNNCYVSDVTNRLLGWNGIPGTKCTIPPN